MEDARTQGRKDARMMRYQMRDDIRVVVVAYCLSRSAAMEILYSNNDGSIFSYTIRHKFSATMGDSTRGGEVSEKGELWMEIKIEMVPAEG